MHDICNYSALDISVTWHTFINKNAKIKITTHLIIFKDESRYQKSRNLPLSKRTNVR